MPAARLIAFLRREGVKYTEIEHPLAYTASEVATSSHVPPRDFAKTVILNMDGTPIMLVLPATRRVLIHELREMLESESVRLATETEIRRWFPDCEVGAMPPFGNLYDVDVYVTASLTREKEIAFNAGTHIEAVKMSYADFDRLVRPKIIDLVTT
jgi:Ala-tRNA(Pro) deacylase